MKKTVLKTSLDHLPFNHQQDLAFIKDTILKYIPAEMIILFGSYARGDYVIDVSALVYMGRIVGSVDVPANPGKPPIGGNM